ncbi:hypothetical protein GGF31_001308 [Allomyces arbusculus]|nr:hypothetical protein GGF31_001308 [Allomyces arbusculus]
MSSTVSKLADFVQKATVAGLATISVLGLYGVYQTTSARMQYSKEVTEKIRAREQELIAIREAKERAEAAAAASTPAQA